MYHFDFEEGMLEAVGYPNLDIHHQEHQRFVDNLEELSAQDVDTYQDKVAFEMLGFVANWIEQHILNTDFKYKDYV